MERTDGEWISRYFVASYFNFDYHYLHLTFHDFNLAFHDQHEPLYDFYKHDLNQPLHDFNQHDFDQHDFYQYNFDEFDDDAPVLVLAAIQRSIEKAPAFGTINWRYDIWR